MNKTRKSISHLFSLTILVYLVLLLMISGIACTFAYRAKRENVLAKATRTMDNLDWEYTNILENFWQIYMPAFEKGSAASSALQEYFAFSDADDLDPLSKNTLKTVLQQMMIRDSRIQWIGLYSACRDTNYILYTGVDGIHTIRDDFPYLDDLKSGNSKMTVLPAQPIPDFSVAADTFAICGNAPIGFGSGKIIAGYSTGNFEKETKTISSELPWVNFSITLAASQINAANSQSIDAQNVELQNSAPQNSTSTIIFASSEDFSTGNDYYSHSILTGNNSTYLVCQIHQRKLFLFCASDFPFILGIAVLFTLFSIAVHYLIDRSVKKELSIIRTGLSEVSENQPFHSLPTNFQQEELPEIAQSINKMGSKLNENIEKAYYFELKQKDAQLAELQATFNPHFLYNTLEMLHSKSYSNGDFETAELIMQLSALFRGFINAKTFITIKEELAFCNRYLSLLSARYGDLVDVQYNIPGELLNYGIIRNVFQLIIENYFVHGFDADNEDNFIRFCGRSANETDLILSVQDNGTGITPDALEKLRRDIEAPIRHGEKSYGLKNLNQRLKLFYGPDYGLTIPPNQEHGFYLEIRLKKMYVSDYEKAKEERPIPPASES